MRFLSAFGTIALIFATVLAGGEKPATKGPKIAGETNYGPYELVRLKASECDPKATIRWRVTPDADVLRADTPIELLQCVAPPGNYVVDLLAVKVVGEKAEIEEARVTVRISSYKDKRPVDKDVVPKDKDAK